MTDPGSKLMRGLLEAFILERLDANPRHGYALLKDMEERFGVAPNRNKIYPLLARFEEEGLVRREAEKDGTRGKTMFVIMDAGRAALTDYRRVPRAFRESLERLWPLHDVAKPDAARGVTRARPATAPPDPSSAAAQIPADSSAPSPDADALPYPCPDARVIVEKDPRTGRLAVRLAGCPMGTFEYCPMCPVHQSIAGLRRLTFG